MENKIRVFENQEFGKVRTIVINDEPWFVGKDVTSILGYTNASKALTDHVDSEDKLNNESLSSLGQRGGWLINESGLYSLILSSKLPTAKKFKRWVTSEVLPSIRKNGGYIAGQETLSDEELMAKALMVAQRTIENKNKQIAEMKPKVDFYNDVTGSTDTIDIASVAKVLNVPNMGRNKLFAFLREKNILNKRNEPYQCFVDKGYFRQVESKWEHDGTIHINLKTVVFQKGLDFIHKLVLEHKN